MRILLLMIMLTGFLSASEFWIQVASVKSADSLTSEFMKKVDASGLEKKVVVDAKWCHVYLGSFKRELDALEVLPAIRCRVASDAYIVSALVEVTEEVVPVQMAPTNMDVTETVLAKNEGVISSEAIAVDTIVPNKEPVVKNDGFGIEKGKQCRCICDAKARKEAKMKEALAFYKKSDVYHFSYSSKKHF